MTTIIQGNIIEISRQLAKDEKQFQAIITSPPYWMLRDYGTPPQHWEGMAYKPMPGLPAIVVPEWEGELGQEPDVNDFIGHLVYCFRELKPVLRDDGTLWVNLGDSYFTTGKTTGIASSLSLEGRKQTDVMPTRMKKKSQLIPNKNRVGVPWRFAMAMQADGWYWRDEIVWSKTSPMPGSQTDRCTVSHEVILMFSKEPRYFYDYHAIQEKSVNAGKRVTLGDKSFSKGQAKGAGISASGNGLKEYYDVAATRNPRSVWTMSTEPSKEKHFASWPSKLAAKMIKAATSEKGCCAACGAPWAKIIKRERVPTRPGDNSKLKNVAGWAKGKGISHDTIAHTKRRETVTEVGNRDPLRHTTTLTVTGWKPTCTCLGFDTVPCSVLDPFGGTGKTALAAERLHRRCTLIELKQEYADRAMINLERIRKEEVGMFA